MTKQKDYKTFRHEWSAQHKTLRAMLEKPAQHDAAIDLFLQQHAVLHSAQIAQPAVWSYADEIMAGLSEAQMRRLLPGQEHSVVWMVWHMARIEDVAMNMLVAGTPQILDEGDWLRKLHAPLHNTGNEISKVAVAKLSETVDIKTLFAYRLAVGQRTRAIVQLLQPGEPKNKVDPTRIDQVLANGAVIEAASGITDYWRKRTIAGLLLMPPTRHNLVHLNEIEKLKQKL